MSFKASVRIAVSQFVLFFLLSYTFISLSYTFKENKDLYHRVLRQGSQVIAVAFVIPLVLSVVLIYAILTKNIVLIRVWILLTTMITILFLFLLLSGAIYISLDLDKKWSFLLIALPFVLALWMMEGVIVVSDYYKTQETEKTHMVVV